METLLAAWQRPAFVDTQHKRLRGLSSRISLRSPGMEGQEEIRESDFDVLFSIFWFASYVILGLLMFASTPRRLTSKSCRNSTISVRFGSFRRCAFAKAKAFSYREVAVQQSSMLMTITASTRLKVFSVLVLVFLGLPQRSPRAIVPMRPSLLTRNHF